MRFLFVKPNLVWPRSSGHDVHTFEMMRSLVGQGAEIALLTVHPITERAVQGLDLVWRGTLEEECTHQTETKPNLSWMQRKFASYWGVPDEHIARVADVARQVRADIVVVVGLGVLPYLGAVKGAARVWYAADEWVLHHLTLFRPTDKRTYAHLKPALIKGLYERAYTSVVDRVWVVSEADRRAARLFMGARAVDVVPNGVDSQHFRPTGREELPDSAVFWGRLDFEPNIDALRWFVTSVWSDLRALRPSATFTIFGFNPTPEVASLAQTPGVEVRADLPDLREEIAERQIVMLPFISGAGIKNKLLEAAAMGRPIIASPQSLNGLRLVDAKPVLSARSPSEWVEKTVKLWDSTEQRLKLGSAARSWVIENHSWDQCAETVLSNLDTIARPD